MAKHTFCSLNDPVKPLKATNTTYTLVHNIFSYNVHQWFPTGWFAK